MSDKKKPGRFTIQFNLEDPQQRSASHLLEQHGRRKAQFITSAVLSYTREEDPALNQDTLEKTILSVIRRHPEILSSAAKDCREADRHCSSHSAQSMEMNTDAVRAIYETLADFQL